MRKFLHQSKLLGKSQASGLDLIIFYRHRMAYPQWREELQTATKSSSDALLNETNKNKRNYRVLLIDNEEDILFIIKRLLIKHHIVVYTAQNGLEALNKIEQVNPHLVMADIKMPIMDGFEFVRNLRQHKNAKIRALPVIAITAFAGEAVFNQVFAAGFNNCLFKPFDENGIVKMIQDSTSYCDG